MSKIEIIKIMNAKKLSSNTNPTTTTKQSQLN